MKNITGIILVHNNELTISESVQSIKGLVSELIVIDDFSTDRTVDIIKENYPDAKIFKKKLIKFNEQRNYAINLASHDWVLMVDSDEIVDSKLFNALKSLDLRDDEIDGYWAIRLNRFFSVRLEEKNPDKLILFRKFLQFADPVHEVLMVDKKRVSQLAGYLIHENCFKISANINKLNFYSDLLARKWIEQNRNYNDFQLLFFAFFSPIIFFFYYLLVKGFYRAGLDGIIYSAILSADWLIVIAKYRELRTKDKH